MPVTEEMTCPQCQSAMVPRFLADVTVHQCASCQGVYLARAELGNLAEAEADFHRGGGPATQPMPRISVDTPMPPPSRPVTRSYVESLFG